MGKRDILAHSVPHDVPDRLTLSLLLDIHHLSFHHHNSRYNAYY